MSEESEVTEYEQKRIQNSTNHCKFCGKDVYSHHLRLFCEKCGKEQVEK